MSEFSYISAFAMMHDIAVFVYCCERRWRCWLAYGDSHAITAVTFVSCLMARILMAYSLTGDMYACMQTVDDSLRAFERNPRQFIEETVSIYL